MGLSGHGATPLRLSVFNLLGSKVREMEIRDVGQRGEVEIDLSGLPDGIYLIRPRVNGQIRTGRIIKEQ